MALNQQFLRLIVWLKEQGHLDAGRKVVEIGSQQLNDGFMNAKDDIEHLCRLFGVAVPSLPVPLANGASRRLDPAAPYARSFYEALGYTYAYVDIDAPGGYPRDLNFDSVPAHLVGQHHLVTNFGTTEHVINQLNAFKVIHDLTAVGGIMIHELPAQGEINHAFFNYHPKFFERLAHSNGYDVLFFDFRWHEAKYGIPEPVQRLIGASSRRTIDRASSHRRPRSQRCCARPAMRRSPCRWMHHWAPRLRTRRSRSATHSRSRAPVSVRGWRGPCAPTCVKGSTWSAGRCAIDWAACPQEHKGAGNLNARSATWEPA
jgi:hypothetical protein